MDSLRTFFELIIIFTLGPAILFSLIVIAFLAAIEIFDNLNDKKGPTDV